MRIDPVVELAEELRAAERSLLAAEGPGRHEAMRDLLLEIGYLESRLALTTPTSALGSGELLRLAAQHVRPLNPRDADRLLAIADRLIEGGRRLSDIVWLRMFAAALADKAWGDKYGRAARLISSAVLGAARPVLVYRTTTPLDGARGVRSGTR